MRLVKLTKDCQAWRNFLKENNHLIIHTPEWKEFIETTFPRTKAKYYALTTKEEIKCIFPLFNTKFSIIPNISSTFLEYGGPIGKVTKNQFEKIKNKLPKNIEIRHGLSNKFLSKNFIEVNAFKRFVLQLGTEEDMWKHIHKFKRKAVRLADKSGIKIKDVPKKDMASLYNLYLKSMRSFGTPPYTKKYFTNFYTFFVDKNIGKIVGAYYKKKLVSVLMGFTISKQIHVNINFSDPRYLKFRTNDAVYWEFIKWGCNNNYSEFDFGRTWEESGQFAFKKKWKAELLDLNHFYFSKPNDFRFVYDMFSKVWKNVPLSVTKLVGPYIRENFGI